MSDQLTAPRTSVELEDTGLNDIENSDDSSDQFTDASEGRRRAASQASDRSQPRSPIPITRVERVDDEPAYGEVPGTEAYKKRTQDAVPDEVEVVNRSRSASRVESPSPSQPIPTIVAMKIDPDVPGYGDVPGTEAYEQRRADAQPDIILKSPEASQPPPNPWSSGSPAASQNRSTFRRHSTRKSQSTSVKVDHSENTRQEEEFGDDFDDFAEGQADGDDEDFGDFDDFRAGEEFEEDTTGQLSSPSPVVTSITPIPSIDWSEIDGVEDLEHVLEPYLKALYPQGVVVDESTSQTPSAPPQTFLSDRSLSLYQQLVAPPPLAPPNWLRSRIRRLFFVSLGVPVDLDEILPASKQKKLILPSIHVSGESGRDSTDSRQVKGTAISDLKGQNESTLSVDTNGKAQKSSGSQQGTRKRGGREVETEPQFDTSEAVRLGNTTEAKLLGLDDEELQAHVKLVEQWSEQAREVLGYWQRRKQGAEKEKEAFEGVIENLVKHARKVRK